MAHNSAVWTPADIRIEPVDDGTDDPVMTLRVILPGGAMILVMAELEANGAALIARRLHIHGEGIGPNEVGPGRLRVIARKLLQEMGYAELILEGADRTTGAGPGRRPNRLRFTAQPGADPDDRSRGAEDGHRRD